MTENTITDEDWNKLLVLMSRLITEVVKIIDRIETLEKKFEDMEKAELEAATGGTVR